LRVKDTIASIQIIKMRRLDHGLKFHMRGHHHQRKMKLSKYLSFNLTATSSEPTITSSVEEPLSMPKLTVNSTKKKVSL